MMSYVHAVKFGKTSSSTPIDKSYSFSSRFADALNEVSNETSSSSFFHAQDPSRAWSKRYFDALDLPEGNTEEKMTKYLILHCIHNDFVTTATTYAKTIISEHYISDWKTIHPDTSMGGKGGEKYNWHGIMFKFATAEGKNDIFEGSEENAARAMGHEIKGANSYIRTRIPSLCYALQCLVDYKGFRMHCQAKLDIDNSTLKVGSPDGGKCIKADDKELLEQMKFAAQELNIREHTVKGITLYAALDCEGHRGKDGRCYLVDLARVFPPESPGILESFGVKSPPFELRKFVFVKVGEERKLGTIINIHPVNNSSEEVFYDVYLRLEGVTLDRVPGSNLDRGTQQIFWKFLRPEFVKSRGRNLTSKYVYTASETRVLEQTISRYAAQYDAEMNMKEEFNTAEQYKLSSRVRNSSNNLSALPNSPSANNFSVEAIAESVAMSSSLFNNRQDSDEYSKTPYFNPVDDDTRNELSNSTPFQSVPGRLLTVTTLWPVGVETPSDVEQVGLPALDRPHTDAISQDDDDDDDDAVAVRADDVRPLTREKSQDGYSSVPEQYATSTTQDEINETPPSDLSPPVASPRNHTKKMKTLLSAPNAKPETQQRIAPLPLSSDAYSGFTEKEPERPQRQQEVQQATTELLFFLVPIMAKDLLHHGHPNKRALITMADYMHYYGLNFRHGGYFRFVFLHEFDKCADMFVSSRQRRSSSAASTLSQASAASLDNEIVLDNGTSKIKRANSFDDLMGSTLNRTNSFRNIKFPASPSIATPPLTIDSPAVDRDNSGETGAKSSDSTSPRKSMASEIEIYNIQCDLLKECISRTLKCMLREIERDWMRSQKTSSEQGLKKVIVQFLNIVSGAHTNSKKFWEETIPAEIVLRFGELSLVAIPSCLGTLLGECSEEFESDDSRLRVWMGQSSVSRPWICADNQHRTLNLWELIVGDPLFLHGVVEKLCAMTGIQLSHDCEAHRQQFRETLKTQSHNMMDAAEVGRNPSNSTPKIVRSPSPFVATPIIAHSHFSFDETQQYPLPAVIANQNIVNRQPSLDDPFMLQRARTPGGKSMSKSVEKPLHYGPKKAAPFKFVVADVVDIVPVVKHLHQLDFVTGAMLTLQAEEYIRKEEFVVASRILKTSIDTLLRARRAVPDDINTRREVADAYQLEAQAIFKQRALDAQIEEELNAKIQRLSVDGSLDKEQQLKKLQVQLTNVKQAIARGTAVAQIANRTYLHLHEIDAHTCCKHSRLSYRDDIIGIVVEVVTKKLYYKPDQKTSPYLPPLRIVSVNIRPGCMSLSRYRAMLETEIKSLQAEYELAKQKYPTKNIPLPNIRKRFLPLIIDEEHAGRALPLLKEEILRTDRLPFFESPLEADQLPVRIPAELKIRPYSKQGLPHFDHEIGFRVISAIMCEDVVNICKNAAEQGVKSFSTDTVVGYLRLYHMLLYLADNDPCNKWRELANKTVCEFIESPMKRSKDHTPNLGWFLIFLLLSKYSWERVAVPFFQESLIRQVYWYLTENPTPSNKPSKIPNNSQPYQDDESSFVAEDHDDLMSVSSFGAGHSTPRLSPNTKTGPVQQQNNYSPQLACLATDDLAMHYRLFKTFEVTKLSARIILFQVYFLNMTSRRDLYAWSNTDDDGEENIKLKMQREDLQLYNSSLGFPTAMVRSDLVDEFQKILNISDYQEFLHRLALYYNPGQMAVFLRNAVRKNRFSTLRYFHTPTLGSMDPEDEAPHAINGSVVRNEDGNEYTLTDENEIQQHYYQQWCDQWNDARKFYKDALAEGKFEPKVKEWVEVVRFSRQQIIERDQGHEAVNKHHYLTSVNTGSNSPGVSTRNGQKKWGPPANKNTPPKSKGNRQTTSKTLTKEALDAAAAESAPPAAANSPLWTKSREYQPNLSSNLGIAINETPLPPIAAKLVSSVGGLGIADAGKSLTRTYSNVTSSGVSAGDSMVLSRTNSNLSMVPTAESYQISKGSSNSPLLHGAASAALAMESQHMLTRTFSNTSVTSNGSGGTLSDLSISLPSLSATSSPNRANQRKQFLSNAIPAKGSIKTSPASQSVSIFLHQLGMRVNEQGHSPPPTSHRDDTFDNVSEMSEVPLGNNNERRPNTVSSDTWPDATGVKKMGTRPFRSGSIESDQSSHSCPDPKLNLGPSLTGDQPVGRGRSNSTGDSTPSTHNYPHSRSSPIKMSIVVDDIRSLRAEAPCFTPMSQRSTSTGGSHLSDNSGLSHVTGHDKPLSGRRNNPSSAKSYNNYSRSRNSSSNSVDDVFPGLNASTSSSTLATASDLGLDSEHQTHHDSVSSQVNAAPFSTTIVPTSWVSIVAKTGPDTTNAAPTASDNSLPQSLVLQALDEPPDIDGVNSTDASRQTNQRWYKGKKDSPSNRGRGAPRNAGRRGHGTDAGSGSGPDTRRRSESAPFPMVLGQYTDKPLRSANRSAAGAVAGFDDAGPMSSVENTTTNEQSQGSSKPTSGGSAIMRRGPGRFGHHRGGGRGGGFQPSRGGKF